MPLDCSGIRVPRWPEDRSDAADHVLYVQTGRVKLWVLSKAGKEAVVAVLGPGDFCARTPARVGGSGSATQSRGGPFRPALT